GGLSYPRPPLHPRLPPLHVAPAAPPCPRGDPSPSPLSASEYRHVLSHLHPVPSMLTNRSSFLVSVLTLVLGLPLAAQAELVVNGDFENNNTNGWTFSGYTVAAQVSPFDTTGIGTSPCFNNRPGGQQTP